LLDLILDSAAHVRSILWGPWTIIFFAFVAVYLTIRSGFFQVRGFVFIFKNTFGKILEKAEEDTTGKITPFQAVSTSLAGTVGMGNMAGVCTALSIGGPGAIFWMWLSAFFGMMTKTAEITIGVHYREVDEKGHLHGGPMYYITKGLGWTALAKLYSIGMLVCVALSATLLQAHTVGRAFLSGYGLNPYITTGAMAVVTGIVVIGGVKRIGQFCARLVPVMTILYVAGGIIIFFFNYTEIPEVFSMIFGYAFAPSSALGGFAGSTVALAIREGMSKGMLSNEAGEGTAPMAHVNAKTPHPFIQGVWGGFEVFVDTILICTITSFAVLSTGVLAGGESGIELLMSAFSSVFPGVVTDTIISFSILAFCLSTQIGFFIYYETAIVHLFGEKVMPYVKWLYLIPGVVFAGVADVDKLWVFADISVGSVCIPNLIGVLALSGVFFRLMKDYMDEENNYLTSLTDVTKNYVKKAKK